MSTTIYTDGACRGNPGQGAYSFIVFQDNKEIFRESALIAGVTTNNKAEYLAIAKAMQWAGKNNITKFTIFSDSKLAINQIIGEWKVKEPELKAFIYTIRGLLAALPKDAVTFTHTTRETNGISICDKMCNEILDCGKSITDETTTRQTWQVLYRCPVCGATFSSVDGFCEACDTILVEP